VKILMLTAEARPYATAGGTSAVTSALSRELARAGHDVRLVMPCYQSIVDRFNPQDCVTELHVPDVGGGLKGYAKVDEGAFAFPVFFIGGDPHSYFRRVTGDAGAAPIYPRYPSDEAGEIYAFFCRAALELAEAFARGGWTADVIHCHDWPTGLAPAYLKTVLDGSFCFKDTAVVFTFHNISDVVYQGGWFGRQLLDFAGIPPDESIRNRLMDKGSVNFMKAAISFSDQANTVSTTYLAEVKGDQHYVCGRIVESNLIRTRMQRYGAGLEGFLCREAGKLRGIRNGIDVKRFDPRESTGTEYITGDNSTMTYDPHQLDEVLTAKREIKRLLQTHCREAFGAALEVDSEVPIIAVRSRFASQKGFDLITSAVPDFMRMKMSDGREPQLVIAAWDPDTEEAVERLETRVREFDPDGRRIVLRIGRREHKWAEIGIHEFAHYACCDMLLMPSLFEPCGLPQMLVMRYGTIPIVRRTGGLADTVQDFDPIAKDGNGFDFVAEDPREMLRAIGRALGVYENQALWAKLMENAVRDSDNYGWATSAGEYTRMYEDARGIS